MAQRLSGLGVTLASLSQDGQTTVHPAGGGRWVERLILGSPIFVATARRLFAALRDQRGSAVEFWPGLWLLALPTTRRRRVGPPRTAREHEPIVVALLLGHALLQSEQFRLVCDGRQTDLQAAIARVDAAALLTESEAARMAMSIAWMHEDSLEIDRRLAELQGLSAQLGESYEELSLLYKLSSSMTVNARGAAPLEFLTDACAGLREVAGLTWMTLQLADDDPRLGDLAGQSFTAGHPDCDPAMLRRIGKLLLTRLPELSRRGGLILDDAASLGVPHLGRIARDLLVVELVREGRSLGLLLGANKLDGSHLTSVDTKLCSSLAGSLAIFLENSMLYEDMHAMFLGVLHALTASIDAKDSYTHGHSERVALLSRMLAQAAGLDAHTVERVYVSALVHDVGKIGVPEAVLCKPGQLTAEEFDAIKKHPEIGARILADIRQMQDLIPGVLHHHERWDGRGYPMGLAGADIPLLGRLICLADSFDAMSSNRTYRRALMLEQVLGEVTRCAGSQFDPDLAALFVAMDFDPFRKLLATHNDRSQIQEHAP